MLGSPEEGHPMRITTTPAPSAAAHAPAAGPPPGALLWTSVDIARYLRLGKTATHAVIASPDFPAPVVGGRRYRRYLPEQVIAWAQHRAAMNDSNRRAPRARVT
jgi:hypothetical protein